MLSQVYLHHLILCTPNVETVVIHDVDLELLKKYKSQGSTLNWFDRRQDLYEVVLKK